MTNIAISELTGRIELNLTVTGLRAASWRFKAMSIIFRFGAWVGGFGGVEIEAK